LDQVTDYWYDLAEQHVREKTMQGGATYQDNLMAYDELGRLRHVSDGRMSIDMEYDAVGNRTNLHTFVNVPTLADPTVDVPKETNVYYTYDSMNRQTGVGLLRTANSDGTFRYDFNVQLNGIEIVPGVSGHKITYDLNGNRASDTYLGTKVRLVAGTAPTYYEENGELIELTPGTEARYEVEHMPMHWEVTETYDYDALNRLTTARRDGVVVDQRRYDEGGRVVVQGPQGLSKSYSDAINTGVASGDAVGKEYRINRYDSNGRLMRQQAFETDEHRQQQMTSDTKYTAYDKAGNVVSYTMRVPGEYTNTYTYERAKFDGYKEKSLHATSTKFEEGQTDSFYDVNGNLVRIDDHKKDQNDRTLVNDLAGHALYVKQGTAIRRQVVVNGEVLGRYGIGVDEKKPRDKDGNPNFVVIADFTDGYQPITGNYPAASVGSYQVQGGDTLRSIARQSYGDEGMWYRIAESNGLSGDRDLRVGQTITIPSAVGTVRNNSGTYQPYDASKITGDTMPHMPTPQNGGGGCGGIGMILVIVVAVIATVFTAGAAAIAMGAVQGAALTAGGIMSAGATVLTGAAVGGVTLAAGTGAAAAAFGAAVIGAAVGSIASQGVAMAIGLQDKFSWKQVGMSALGGAVSSAIPAGAFANFPGGATAGLVVRSAVNNAVTQGIGVATGLQDKFNWRGVAASAAATFVGESLKGAVMGTESFDSAGESLGRSGGLVGELGGGTAAKIAGSTILGVAAGSVAAVARGGKFSMQQVAVDAFGNALGEAMMAEMIVGAGSRESTFQDGQIGRQELRAGKPVDVDSPDLQEFMDAFEAASGGPVDRSQDVQLAAASGFKLGRGDNLELSSAGGGDREDIEFLKHQINRAKQDLDEIRSVKAATARAEAITSRLNRESTIRESVTPIESDVFTVTAPSWLAVEESSMSAQAAQAALQSGVLAALEVPLMAVDLVHAGVGSALTATFGVHDNLPMLSQMGRGAMDGATVGESLQNLNPVYGLMVGTYEAQRGLERGDTRPLASLSGGILGGAVAGRFTPNLPGYRAGTFSPSTVRVGRSAANAVASVFDNSLVDSYMYRTGMRMYAVPPGPASGGARVSDAGRTWGTAESPRRVPFSENDVSATIDTSGGWGGIHVNVEGKSVQFGIIENTPDGPAFVLDKTTTLPGGEVVKLDGRGFTNIALRKTIAAYKDAFGVEPPGLPGNLGMENLTNFQSEFVAARSTGLNANAAGQMAINRISFGSARSAVGYGNFSLDLGSFGDVMVNGDIHSNVPGSVAIRAGKN
jgi:hypothetical protein